MYCESESCTEEEEGRGVQSQIGSDEEYRKMGAAEPRFSLETKARSQFCGHAGLQSEYIIH